VPDSSASRSKNSGRRKLHAGFGGSRQEDTVGHACVQVHVVVDRRTKAMQEEAK